MWTGLCVNSLGCSQDILREQRWEPFDVSAGLGAGQKHGEWGQLVSFAHYPPLEGPSTPQTGGRGGSGVRGLAEQEPHIVRTNLWWRRARVSCVSACRRAGGRSWCSCPSLLPCGRPWPLSTFGSDTGFMGHMAGSPQLVSCRKPEKRSFPRGVASAGLARGWGGAPFCGTLATRTLYVINSRNSGATRL